MSEILVSVERSIMDSFKIALREVLKEQKNSNPVQITVNIKKIQVNIANGGGATINV